jgi:1-deoxyxylulose-5-phosphate synthase
MPLEYRQLGNADLRVSSIGLGCVTFGREIDAVASFGVLDRALQRGVTLLDTAAVYGNGASESLIGQWLRDRKARDNVILATKASGRLTRENIVQSVEGSLRRLGADRIDLLQAHEWDDQTPLSETLEAFHSLVCQGKVRYWGASN